MDHRGHPSGGGTTVEVSVRQPDGTWKMVIDDPMF